MPTIFLHRFSNSAFIRSKPVKTIFGRSYLYEKYYPALVQALIDSAGYLLFRRGRTRPENIRRILVSRIDHVGDVFLASSVLPHLKNAYPAAKIDFMAGHWNLFLLRSNPHVNEVLAYNSFKHERNKGLIKRAAGGLTSFVKNVRRLRSVRYDLAIDLRAYPFNSVPLLYLGGARYNVGFATGGNGFLLDRVIPYRSGGHEAAHLSDALASLGIRVPEEELRPRFLLSEEACKNAAGVLDQIGIKEGERFVLIHTGSGNPAKLWKKERWLELIQMIGAKGIKIALYDDIYLDMGSPMLPKMPIETFAAATSKAAAFVGLDSFPAHLAASFDAPTIVIWCGTGDYRRWRPLGEKVSVIRRELKCSPCSRKNGCETMECMDISASDCMKALASTLSPK